MSRSGSHVAIVGAGSVGTTIAYATLVRGLASRVSIHDIDGARVEAEVLDLSHGSEFVPVATIDGSDQVEVCRDADLIVVTVARSRSPARPDSTWRRGTKRCVGHWCQRSWRWHRTRSS